jgi:hypothetical protein
VPPTATSAPVDNSPNNMTAAAHETAPARDVRSSAVEGLLPMLPHPDDRDLGVLLGLDAGQTFMSGNRGWFAVITAMGTFNTVLGEELLFRGLLLPRTQGVFGRWDWAANGILFALYHLHTPWVVPWALLDAFILAIRPGVSKRADRGRRAQRADRRHSRLPLARRRRCVPNVN